MMNYLMYLSLSIPMASFFLSLFFDKKNEKLISRFSIFSVGLHVIVNQVLVVLWWLNDMKPIETEGPSFYDSDHIRFGFTFYFDQITVAYILVGSILTFLVANYSRIYMHREEGYKKFFTTILFFYTGYNVVVTSGNFETLFLGWEFLGLSSFLLIGFYRERYLPVRNAAKVYSIYRLGDLGLVLVGWIYYQIWHEPILFSKVQALSFDHSLLMQHPYFFEVLCLCVILSASAKSAQFPFCSWLARAMEGPTPSSAIFYGSLSVHIGLFILLRTAPLWQSSFEMKVLIAVLGFITAVVCTLTSKVQSSIKGQIAYSSVTQIGIMFIELAFGLNTFVLFHFAGNAFLRTYQLLVSPSVVSYLIREKLYKPSTVVSDNKNKLIQKIKLSIYILSVREWYLDYFLEFMVYRNIKRLGQLISKFMQSALVLSLIGLAVIGYLKYAAKDVDANLVNILSFVVCLQTLFYMLYALSEKEKITRIWNLVLFSHLSISLVVMFTDHFEWEHVALYLSGILGAWALGLLILTSLQRKIKFFHIFDMQGYVHRFPKYEMIFLLCCLGISGFPISPTFVGEDLIFHHIHADNIWTVFFASALYVIDGVACIRLYSLLFLGPARVIQPSVALAAKG